MIYAGSSFGFSIMARRSSGFNHGEPRSIIRWQFEQIRIRSVSFVVAGPDLDSGMMWWHSM